MKLEAARGVFTDCVALDVQNILFLFAALKWMLSVIK